jgi:hypothetical protein
MTITPELRRLAELCEARTVDETSLAALEDQIRARWRDTGDESQLFAAAGVSLLRSWIARDPKARTLYDFDFAFQLVNLATAAAEG